MLGPLLFVLYIYDLPNGLASSTKMYADDSKIMATVNNESERQNLLENLLRVCEWSNTWLMSLNFEKCKILHFGKRNQN